MTVVKPPDDLRTALDAVPEAAQKWMRLPESERQAYLRWIDGPRLLRRARVSGTVSRVLWDRPQRGLLGRLWEGMRTDPGPLPTPPPGGGG